MRGIGTILVALFYSLCILIGCQNRNKAEENKADTRLNRKKMRRNEPCYCGSGKKYKHCCGTL